MWNLQKTELIEQRTDWWGRVDGENIKGYKLPGIR